MTKLRLNRETLRALTPHQLRSADGGVSVNCPSGGLYPKYTYCNCRPTGDCTTAIQTKVCTV